MIRIKFTGDIMCQIAQNEACHTNGAYCYAPVFAKAMDTLADCDFLVGNLETPLAGPEQRYSYERYSFNTPDAFAYALKEAGFHALSTANNHCMDRGIEGIVRTLRVVREAGMDPIGTQMPGERRAYVKSIGGIRVGFISYTYGTNAFFHHQYLPTGWEDAVNLLQPEECMPGAIDLLDEGAIEARVRELYGAPNRLFAERIAPMHERMRTDIADCRAAGAEYVIALLHCGGQYNAMPDAYTRHIVRVLRGFGVDAIVGHHPHVVHPLEQGNGCPVAYSLGNFTDTPQNPPRGSELRSVYSAVLCLEIEERKGIQRVSHEWMKSVLRLDGICEVVPVDRLLLEATAAERAALEEDVRFCETVLATPVPE